MCCSCVIRSTAYGIIRCIIFNVPENAADGRLAAENTLCPIKTCDYIFYNNFNNKCPITIIFGIVSSQSRRR